MPAADHPTVRADAPGESPVVAPVAAAERHGLVDVLRGVALLGILLVNVELFASVDHGWARPQDRDLVDLAAHGLIVGLFQLKSYLLFSLLFGYGLAVMLSRAGDRAFRPRYVRRLLMLAVLGLLHAVFLYVGDILLSYAILGFLLLTCRNMSTARLLRTAALAMAVGLVLIVGLGMILTGMEEQATHGSTVAHVFASGSFGQIAAERFAMLPDVLITLVLTQWAAAFAMFLLGVLLARKGILARPDHHRRLLRRMARVGLPVGLAGGAAAAALTIAAGPHVAGPWVASSLMVEWLFAPALTLGFVGAMGLATSRGWWPALERLLAPAGRMSLTVYLGQSVACSMVFDGYGLGLHGDVGPAVAAALAVAIWTLGLVLARLWFRRFRFGPAEWLLRTATYARRQPLRLPAAGTS